MRPRFVSLFGVFAAFVITGCLSLSFATAAWRAGKINGRVKDRAGNYLPNINVSATNKAKGRRSPAPQKTKSGGFYEFPSVDAGRYDLEYKSKQHKTEYRYNVEVSNGRTTEVLPDVVLKPKGSGAVSGKVTDTTGRGVENAKVLATATEEGEGGPFPTRTNAQGDYQLTIPEGTYHLTAEAPGFLLAAAGVEVEAGQGKQVNLVLTPVPKPPRVEALVKPSRPGVAAPADFHLPGILQLEFGYEGSFRSKEARTEQRAPLTLRYAAHENLLLEASLDTVNSLTPEPDRVRRTGVGDVRLGVQVAAPKSAPELPTAALAYHVKLPLGDEAKGLSTGRVDHRFTLLFSHTVDRNTLDLNSGLLFVGREGGRGWEKGWFWAASWQREFKDDFKSSVELAWLTKEDVLRPGVYALGALSYTLNPKLVLDSGVRVGLNPNAPRFGVFAGLSVTALDFRK